MKKTTRNRRPARLVPVFRYFLPWLKPYRNTLLWAALCMLGATLMELLRPWPIKLVFDGILIPHPETRAFLHTLFPPLVRQEILLGFVALSILAIAVFTGIFGFWQSYLTSRVGQQIVADIRQRLYRHIHSLSHSFHDENALGDLIARLTGDIRMMRELLVTSVIYLSDRLLTLTGMLLIMAWMDWKLTLTALLVVPLLGVTVFHFNREIKTAARKQRRRESEITSAMTDRLSAITLVQAYAREAYEQERFSRQNHRSMEAGLRATRLEAHMNRLVQVILAVGTAAVLWFGVIRVQTGEITPGDLLVFTAYLKGLYRPIRRLASLTGRIAKAAVCAERIIAIFETRPEIRDRPDAQDAPPFRGEITFDRVDFGYRPGRLILDRASFTVAPGETVALLGPSGAGKSTIAKLLLRFYQPLRGSIRIDGVDVERFTLASLRNQIAVVLQDTFLFNTSIRENIGYGRLDATPEEIVEAAKAACAHDFITRLPDGYDTIVSERGASLSGGQRQRIAVARALIRNAPIVILDEPMTGLDVEHRHLLKTALRNLTEKRTCLVIAHDWETIENADRFLFLNQGKIREIDRNEARRLVLGDRSTPTRLTA